jgi:putative heme-binding domain-containing protein
MPIVAPNDKNTRYEAAASIAQQLKLTEVAPQLATVAQDGSIGVKARSAALGALASLAPQTAVPLAAADLNDPKQPASMQDAAADALATVQSDAARSAILAAIPLAPAHLQTKLGQALVSSPEGAATLLDAVTHGKAPARLLQEQPIVDRIAALNVEGASDRIKKLTQGLPTVKAERQQLIDHRRDVYLAATDPSVERGLAVFTKNCVVCHKIDNNGGAVGPNLDGVGLRGVDRVVEDILDPSRNVDPAFRYSNVILKNSQLITGLEKRREGETIVFIDTTGKEQVVKKSDIKQQMESKLSAMPDNFGELIPENEFDDLLAFLLSHQVKPATPAK